MSLLELAERCERATGSDRELDAAIAAAMHVKQLTYQPGEWIKDPEFTASLDAAMALVPEGSHIYLNGYKAENFWNRARVQTFKQEGETPDDAKAATLPLALCAAALRARAASCDTHPEGGDAKQGSVHG